MNRRRVILAFVGLSTLPLLASCKEDDNPPSDIDYHDCDADDVREGDPDCFPKPPKKTPKPAKTSKRTPKKSPRK
jgi:hypothetical protein